LTTGFGFGITKSTGNDQSHFEETKVHILPNCVIDILILIIVIVREKRSKK